MLSADFWTNLSDTDKLVEFEKMKRLADLRPMNTGFWSENVYVAEVRDHIFRPLLPLSPRCSYYFKTILDQRHPDGDFTEFHNKPPTFENYKLLWYWIENNCEKCGSSTLYWDQTNSGPITVCARCRNEKRFAKGIFD